MAFMKKAMGIGTAFAVAAVLFASFAASASAQTPPFTAYGTGQTPGATVAALIGTNACGTATVDADGNWLIYVQAGGDCAPVEGDTISFTVNGVAQNETATYTAGGAPADVANGITLTAAAAGGGTPAPTPAPTGNGGFVGTTGTSMALVLALGAFAAAMVAGARTATRSR